MNQVKETNGLSCLHGINYQEYDDTELYLQAANVK